MNAAIYLFGVFCGCGLGITFYRRFFLPRKILMVWARMCEAKLKLRDDRGNWRDDGAWFRYLAECDELNRVDSDLVAESIDVSLTVMQYADSCYAICEHDGRGR